LGVAPKMVIAKSRNPSGAYSWVVWHSALLGTEYLVLNSTVAKQAEPALWNSTVPTSTVVSLGSNPSANESTKNIVAYCFAEVQQYSRIGSYVGNGSADGPFVHCGFRPRFVLIRNTAVSNWVLFDTARREFNVNNLFLRPNTSDAETTFDSLDTVACGFKIRNTDSSMNTNGGTYIFLAFSDQVFGGSGLAPANAR